MNSKNRKCDFCHSTEGLPRPIGDFKVQLKTIEVFGVTKLACQTCLRKSTKKSLVNPERTIQFPMSMYLKKMLLKIAGVFVVIILSTASINAQGPPGLPGFPDNPDPAPIDGGLGLLAAAGGAYAMKKLRDKKNLGEMDD